MKRFIPLFLALALVGCFGSKDPIILQGNEVVYTLDHGKLVFYADGAVMESLEPTATKIQGWFLLSPSNMDGYIDYLIDRDNPEPVED